MRLKLAILCNDGWLTSNACDHFRRRDIYSYLMVEFDKSKTSIFIITSLLRCIFVLSYLYVYKNLWPDVRWKPVIASMLYCMLLKDFLFPNIMKFIFETNSLQNLSLRWNIFTSNSINFADKMLLRFNQVIIAKALKLFAALIVLDDTIN